MNKRPNDNLSEQQERLMQISRTAELFLRLDRNDIPEGAEEIRLFAIARNESLRMPHFLTYYMNLGVDRIFIIDNGSEDDTADIAMSYSNVHVYRITESFKLFWFWIEYFLETYGKERWCFVVDVDELFSFPYDERIPLKTLIGYLETFGFTAVKSFLLDMYSNRNIIETNYRKNENPLSVLQYFDTNYYKRETNSYDKKHSSWFKYETTYGGMRQRVFGKAGEYQWSYCLSKNSLFKYSEETYLSEGMHTINGVKFADIEAVTFHTKFLFDFIQEVKIESEREEHFCDGLEYKLYDYHLAEKPSMSLFHKGAVKYKDTKQLIDLGLMKTSDRYHHFLDHVNSQTV